MTGLQEMTGTYAFARRREGASRGSRSAALRFALALVVLAFMVPPLCLGADTPALGPGVNLPKLGGKMQITDADFALIAKSGFRLVRQPVAPGTLAGPDGALSADGVRKLKDRIAQARRHQLSVIVDLHPGADFRHRLFGSGESRDWFVSLWTRIAGALADTDDAVMFELLNEPGRNSVGSWWDLQGKTIAAIRKIDSRHIIIASAERYDTAADLLKQKPYDEPRVVYNFHFYKPMVFTHQGADWGSVKRYDKVHSITWPLDKVGTAKAIDAGVTGRRRKLSMAADMVWSADRIDRLFADVSAWAKRHDATVMCNEFGVYRRGGVNEADRARYLHDVTRALDAHGIPWTIWQYSGGFGVADKHGSGRAMDADILAALGLGQAQK